MATVGEIDGLRVVIYSNDHRPAHVHVIGAGCNDHRPAHVHVIGAGCEAVFKLNCPDGQPELRENYGFTTRKLSRIKTGLMSNLTHFCAEWSRIHGFP